MEEEYLFHYTSAQAVLSIIQHRVLWATSAAFLNDMWEGRLLENNIRSMFQRMSAREAQILTSHLGMGRDQYVSAFSKRPDMLTQFRQYCPPDGGFVVRFPKTFLARCGRLTPVHYAGDRNHPNWAADFVQRYLAAVREVDDGMSDAKEIAVKIEKGSSSWVQERCDYSIAYKASEFSTEEEVRLVSTHSGRQVKVRASMRGNAFILYVEIDLPNEDVLVKVAPGPGAHRELANVSIGALAYHARLNGTNWLIETHGIGDFGYRNI